jgi:hypothetical protein
MDISNIAAIIITLIGWGVTYYYQRKILEQQVKAEKDIKSLEFTHQLALSTRDLKLEILPTARSKMIDTFSRLTYLGRRIIEYPDFNSLTEGQLNDWVKLLEFTDSQKEELLQSPDKTKYYLDTQFWYDARKAQNSLDDFHNYLIQKKLFIDPELFGEFGGIEYFFNNVLAGITSGRRSKERDIESHFVNELVWEAPPLIDKIEKMISDQLNQNFPPKT